MTEREYLKELKTLDAVDPYLAKSLRRLRAVSISFVAAIFLVGSLAIYAVATNFGQETRITQIEQSPCQADPEGKECLKVSRKVAETKPIADTCIPFLRVGYACPAPGSEAAQKVPSRQPFKQKQSGGQGSPNSPSGQGGQGSETPAATAEPTVGVKAPLPVSLCLGPLAVNCP